MSMIRSKAKVTAIGTYTPEKILTNEDMEKIVETSDEWIVKRTGIHERRIAAVDEFTSDLCAKAVEDLIVSYEKEVDDVDLIIVSTTTADYPFPSVACLIQEKFKIKQAGAFDLNATCAGFTYALHVANGLISSGLHQKVLVLAGETLSKVTDYEDRTSCILFGDGAGAVLVEYDEEEPSFINSVYGTKGEGGKQLYRTGLSNKMNGVQMTGNGDIVQNGREVYKWATRTVPDGIEHLFEGLDLDVSDLDWFVPHSANLRMIESICTKTNIPIEKTLNSVEYIGNTSSATIPLALKTGIDRGQLKKGQHVLLYGFGGGLTHLGMLLKWSI